MIAMNNEEKILKILEQIQGDIAGVKSDVADTKSDVAGTKGDIAGMKGDIAGLTQIVAKIEIEHGQSIKALLDGYKMVYEIASQTRDEVYSLKGDMKDVKLDISDIKHDLAEMTKEEAI